VSAQSNIRSNAINTSDNQIEYKPNYIGILQ